jgi:hypothetical protein
MSRIGTIPHAEIRAVLRKLWLFSEHRREALRRQHVGTGLYICEKCSKFYDKKYVDVDHISAVGATPGAKNSTASWDDFITNLFCHANSLMILCKDCHKAKTKVAKKKAEK